MAEIKAKAKGKWEVKSCWVCGQKFRVYPEDRDKFGVRAGVCSDCKHYVEIVEKLQGASMPGSLYILQQLANRIEMMERSVGRLWKQIGGYGGSHGR